jgi:ferredoxin
MLTPMTGTDAALVVPQDEAELASFVAESQVARRALRLAGGGTRMVLPMQEGATTLSTQALDGVVTYEPGELTLIARTGTPLEAIERLLASEGQVLRAEMQTNFSPEQLADPGTARANEILRSCVHCGFCTATCPTYKVLGDELDSPRGRIYLIKDMLENSKVPDAKTVSISTAACQCLSCMTTCPSGVHYMHLVDHAREYIEKTYRRPLGDRALRWLLARILPYPGRFRLALGRGQSWRGRSAADARPRLRAMLDMAPARHPRRPA